ncbi:MAG: DUF3866 family protein [Abditibacteriales bacterium]|nr:DUF3866 family protein [Abditibacteriales bacterium]MDW8367434.1 DUF3866 family protein [Abditibacteriales bacterium]
MLLHRRRRGRVTAIHWAQDDVAFVEVEVDGASARAVNYTDLTGAVAIGDEVLLNTVAVELGLGTGGYHFVMANLSRLPEAAERPGHIMKLRYTPLQINVLSIEEQNSPYHDVLKDARSLQGTPVVVGTLHSQIAPAAAAVKTIRGTDCHVVYVMTDSAALPMAFSHLVRQLKQNGLIDATITTGQSFGGDYEAVNVYSGLIAAKEVAGADFILVAPGPGHVGTGTVYGFSGAEQAQVLDAAHALGGKAIAVLRLSFADPRQRHQGVSHHSLTTLGALTHSSAHVVVPLLEAQQQALIEQQLNSAGITQKHHVVWGIDGRAGIDALKGCGINVTSMGRSVDADPAFFLSASAAGAYAARM